MELERKISLRFTDDEYRQLDEKRASSRLKFQSLGHELFIKWLTGNEKTEATGRATPQEQRILDGILALLRSSEAEPAVVNLIKHYAVVGEEQARVDRKKNKTG